MAPRSWWERLRAFPTTYGDNVRESLKMLGILEQSQSPHPLDWISIRWWAFRIALLTLRRRPRPSIPVNPPLFVDEQPERKC